MMAIFVKLHDKYVYVSSLSESAANFLRDERKDSQNKFVRMLFRLHCLEGEHTISYSSLSSSQRQ